MKLGLVGLGRMGAGIAERLRRDDHEVVGYDRDPALRDVASLEAPHGDHAVQAAFHQVFARIQLQAAHLCRAMARKAVFRQNGSDVLFKEVERIVGEGGGREQDSDYADQFPTRVALQSH